MTADEKPARRPVKYRTCGVSGINDPRWIIAAMCYLTAVSLMGMDPWYGDRHFVYNQGIFTGLLSVLIVAGFCWESALLGEPRGINLLLHVILLLPLTLLIGRLAGAAPDPVSGGGLLGSIKELLTGARDMIGFESVMPMWLTDIFRNPGMLLLIVFIALAFTQRQPRRRLALTTIAFLIPALRTLSHEPRPSLFFAGGCLAMGLGVTLQYCRYGDIAGQKKILERLRTVRDASELRCSLRIARRAVEDGAVTEQTALAIVLREYGDGVNRRPEEIGAITQVLCHRLVREHGILEVFTDENGQYLMPNQTLYELDGLLDEISVWVRKILLTVIVVLWLISPLDLFPDSVPILGAVDDALIALIGAGQWIGPVRAARGRWPRKRR